MRISVYGKDGRFECLKKILHDMGHEICGDGELVVSGFPCPVVVPVGVKLVSCGPGCAPDGVFDIMKDEEYLRENAYLTAEGAVYALMGSVPRTVRGMDCMVVGWGRIGRELCRLLHKMGARVRVMTRRREAWPEIEMCGGVPGLTDKIYTYISDSSTVFSTPPYPVIGRRELERAGNAVIIDLASAPYGVDLKIAEELGVKAWREPALPGRYCPENAAWAIVSSMRRGGMLDG